MAETLNGKIESTFLGYEDHGMPSYAIYLQHQCGHQGFGGYALTAGFTHDAIFSLLNTLMVSSWEKLPGTHVRIVIEDELITQVGHIMEDRWFSLRDLAKEFSG